MPGLDVNSFEQELAGGVTKQQQCVLAIFKHFRSTISLNRRCARCITSSFYRWHNSRWQNKTRWMEFSRSEVTSHSILGRHLAERAVADAVICCWSWTGPDVVFHSQPWGICRATGCPGTLALHFLDFLLCFSDLYKERKRRKNIIWNRIFTYWVNIQSCSSKNLDANKNYGKQKAYKKKLWQDLF